MSGNDLGIIIMASGLAFFLVACGIAIVVASIKQKGDK